MYRPDWFPKSRSVLQIALDVHSTCTGAHERSADLQQSDIRALRWLMNNWQPSLLPQSMAFDEAVRQVIEAALAEVESDWSAAEEAFRKFMRMTGAELPDEDLKYAFMSGYRAKKPTVHKCAGCGYPISPEVDYCGECVCEDDGL